MMKTNIQRKKTTHLVERMKAWIRAPFASQESDSDKVRARDRAPLHAVQPGPLKVSVVIPALNEAEHIAQVVRFALADEATSEIIVIDDSSTDDTVVRAQQAGATVVTSSMLGKGRSMQDGMRVAKEELLVYLDGDLTGLRPGIITELARPLAAEQADFVKASFGRSGGRVTELTARPMLKLFFPEIAHLKQPLGGIIAARKSLLQTMVFEDGYGVDVGLLIDAHRAGARVHEVDIGSLAHESQSLSNLSGMAQEVGRVIFDRAKQMGRLTVEQILSVYELDRQNQADIDFAILKVRKHERIVLLPLEGVVTEMDPHEALAKATGRSDQLRAAMDLSQGDATATLQGIAHTFRFVHQSEFDATANALPIRPGLIELVNQLRRAGYAVGVVSDGFFSVAEVMRRRIFADFALANTLQFNSGVCQGVAGINRGFLVRDDEPLAVANTPFSVSHALAHLRAGERDCALSHIISVGVYPMHQRLLEQADSAYTLASGARALQKQARVITLSQIGDLVIDLEQATRLEKAA
jgi:glycosyltransferase involved in cell wall biosynthesis